MREEHITVLVRFETTVFWTSIMKVACAEQTVLMTPLSWSLADLDSDTVTKIVPCRPLSSVFSISSVMWLDYISCLTHPRLSGADPSVLKERLCGPEPDNDCIIGRGVRGTAVAPATGADRPGQGQAGKGNPDHASWMAC